MPKDINPIYLYEEKYENKFVIRIKEDGEFLKTPQGNLYSSYNRSIIENTIYDLQRYDKINIGDDFSIVGEPLESITIYTLHCTEIDFWSNGETIENQDILSMFSSDPFLNIAPGPEQIDQFHQWRSIIDVLQKYKINFNKIQYYIKDKEEINRLVTLIQNDFNNGSNSNKSIFINLLQFGSPIASWAMTYKDISEIALATAFTETGDFQFSIQQMVNEEIENQKPDDIDEELWEVEETKYDEIYNDKKKVLFNEFLDNFNVLKKFSEISGKLPDEITLEESLTHEYKTSFKIPYPNFPDQEVNENGQSFFRLGSKTFKSKKEIQKFIEEQALKTIVAFLNTKGGKLVLGVKEKDNHKEIIGVDSDDFESIDKYERHIIQQISNRIGKSFLSDFITVSTQIIQGKHICIIKCEPFVPSSGEIPALLDDEKCFRRTGPRTDEVKAGREFANFISTRKIQ